MNVQFLDNYNTDGLTTSIGHNGWVLNGQIFLNLYEKDPQKPNQTNKQICLIIDSYKKLPFPFITWHKKNSDLKGGFFLARIYRILYHNTFLFFSRMMFIILEHTNIHVYEPYVTEWHANVKTFHHWGVLICQL